MFSVSLFAHVYCDRQHRKEEREITIWGGQQHRPWERAPIYQKAHATSCGVFLSNSMILNTISIVRKEVRRLLWIVSPPIPSLFFSPFNYSPLNVGLSNLYLTKN